MTTMMKRYILATIALLTGLITCMAQTSSHEAKAEGTCGHDCKWMFDGYTLYVSGTDYEKKGMMDNYNTSSKQAPWKKKNLNIRKVVIDKGIFRIGDCAFYDLKNLQEVEFKGKSLSEIGWGAFMDCRALSKIKFPANLKDIGKIAFANCDAITSVAIPEFCHVGQQAFASCDNLRSIDLNPTCIIGRNAFSGETVVDGVIRHTLFTGEIIDAPPYINTGNCSEYGISSAAIAKTADAPAAKERYNLTSSDIDVMIPDALYLRNNTYALIIGNEEYRFASDVPAAIHDANIFAEYCRKTLGIPSDNIHLLENATKEMIMEDELHDWLGNIPERDQKTLIVYYAGNGLPDTKNSNKAYIMPSEVRGSSPQRGIALDQFYRMLGDLGFNQTTVFIDAGFSGLSRGSESITDGSRGVGVTAESVSPTSGNVVAFNAASGNEAALGYPQEGHGLFTYWLLKSLRDSNGVISLGTLYDRLNSNILTSAPSIKKGKTQTIEVTYSDNIAPKWRSIRL